MNFEKNIFINCPFDEEYKKFLRPLLFTVIYCGLEPQISQTIDSGSVRIELIGKLIRKSKYSIHDLSRMQAKKVGEIARFNMPFELGLDIGARIGTRGKMATKKCLILDKEKYRYRVALSDISGNDIVSYENSPELMVRKIRGWIASIQSPQQKIVSGSFIWDEYNLFYFDFVDSLKKEGFREKDFKLMSFSEYIRYVKTWVEGRNLED